MDSDQILQAINERNAQILELLKRVMERLDQLESIQADTVAIANFHGQITADEVTVEGDVDSVLAQAGTVNVEGDVDSVAASDGTVCIEGDVDEVSGGDIAIEGDVNEVNS